ncbi:MAG: tRNA preQ1(34) S-adenosylmethionine ribosyltransferase-isomerase QueA [Verrucomicrobiales bacterium]
MTEWRTDDFDYPLPEELIASRPLEQRDASRMMVVHRDTGEIEHRQFTDFPQFIRPDDLVVFNDTRVVRARFFSTDGKIEIVRLESPEPTVWRCLVKPGKKMRLGRQVKIGDATGTVESVFENGDRLVRFDRVVDEEKWGQLALPHYMNRDSDPTDFDRYQTVFAADSKPGAIAAPTAGLHFTEGLVTSLPHAFVTLHVGVGTFQPVRADRITDHIMHSERFELSEATANAIKQAGRVVSVGTTVTRVLEHCALQNPPLPPGTGTTSIFIYPGFEFKCVGALLTNFHLPKSTLLMLVSALAGPELIKQAYSEAVARQYRFFSYGDCMLIL